MGRYQRYESRGQGQGQVKTEKPDIRKMMKYTAKKVLWMTSYSLSFSKKDTGKEILIKLLGCAVILQSLSLIVFFSISAVQIFLVNPTSVFGLLFLALVALFKKEISSFPFKRQKSKTENVYKKNEF